MDHTYEIRMSVEATRDLEEAVNWIKEDSVEAAQVFFNRITKRITTSLIQTPYMGVQLELIEGRQLWALRCGQYRIFYTISTAPRTVSIVRILHTSRDIRSILKTAD